MQKVLFFISIFIISSLFSMDPLPFDPSFVNIKEPEEEPLEKEPVEYSNKPPGSITFKPSYFWPQDKTFRDIYKGGFIPLIEFSYNFYKGLGTWLEIGYFHKREHVMIMNREISTTVTQVPLSLGLNCTYSVCSFFDIYAKIGPNWVYTKTWVDIPTSLKRTVPKNTFGITFGIEGKFILPKNFLIEIFLNYLYDKKKIKDDNSFKTFKVYVGGIQTGVGLGYRF